MVKVELKIKSLYPFNVKIKCGIFILQTLMNKPYFTLLHNLPTILWVNKVLAIANLRKLCCFRSHSSPKWPTADCLCLSLRTGDMHLIFFYSLVISSWKQQLSLILVWNISRILNYPHGLISGARYTKITPKMTI